MRRFVEEGGVYLRVWAGAYYACRELAFHAGTRGAICGTRERKRANVGEGPKRGPLGMPTNCPDTAARGC
ncbi:BPL-N domain-containing protein [Cupriavidus consociatus]|uniref:BPL-N domain-containing protein n=1 Tax=Cupriavidus consociatus TaxID=2821357 RepID=UPI0024DF904C|nr:BPL-N domain-containing protein [Cupriavidus sp. LEh21]MDK2660391.1 BPL-N domain-containing protein [Cupriavidus sp. LEh21]